MRDQIFTFLFLMWVKILSDFLINALSQLISFLKKSTTFTAHSSIPMQS